MLRIRNISKKQGERYLLRDITFEQSEGEKLAIMGETGSGKSTLLKILSGFVQPDGGQVDYFGKKVLGPDEQLIAGHPQIAYLSQHFELRNNYRVHEVLEYANKLDEGEADALFRICQIDHLLDRRTNGNLSGGEKQRIATARLLVNKPKWLLLDEPFSHLDLIHRQTMKQVLQDLGERLGITCLLVSHEPGDVLAWADRLIIIRDGEIEQEGTPEQLYHHPKNEYCAGLLGPFQRISIKLAYALSLGHLPAVEGGMARIRPEQIVQVAPGGGLDAKILRRHFLGHEYEYQLEVAGERLMMFSYEANLVVGQSIQIRLV
jgi:ABC-type sugar transport system ATPase subunit